MESMSEMYQEVRPYVVLVCGGRDFEDLASVRLTLESAQRHADALERPLMVMHGGARGADSAAGDVAASMGIHTLDRPARWDAEGKAAGYKRNQRMAQELRAAVGLGARVAVIHFPGGRGTAHMVRIAHEFGFDTYQGRVASVAL